MASPIRTRSHHPHNGDRSNTNAQTLISAGLLIIGAFGAVWTLMQAQFADVEKTITSNTQTFNDRGTLLRSELLELKRDAVSLSEFRQFQERLNSLAQRDDRNEAILNTLTGKVGREPVEKTMLDAIAISADRRMENLQAQISELGRQLNILQTQVTELNRQVAAAMVLVENDQRRLRAPQ